MRVRLTQGERAVLAFLRDELRRLAIESEHVQRLLQAEGGRILAAHGIPNAAIDLDTLTIVVGEQQ